MKFYAAARKLYVSRVWRGNFVCGVDEQLTPLSGRSVRISHDWCRARTGYRATCQLAAVVGRAHLRYAGLRSLKRGRDEGVVVR